MALTRQWLTSFGQFLPNGSTPKTATQNNLYDAATSPSNVSMLRARTDIELYVRCTATGTSTIDSSVWEETIMAVGLIGYSANVDPATSATPLSTPTDPPGSSGWMQWEYLYPDLMNIDFNAPEVATIVWRPRQGTIDTQARRALPNSVSAFSVWLPWEIQDGSGLINTTTNGVTYNLGARFAQRSLFVTKT